MEFLQMILKDIETLPPDERAETYKRVARHYRQMADVSGTDDGKKVFIEAAEAMERCAGLVVLKQNL